MAKNPGGPIEVKQSGQMDPFDSSGDLSPKQHGSSSPDSASVDKALAAGQNLAGTAGAMPTAIQTKNDPAPSGFTIDVKAGMQSSPSPPPPRVAKSENDVTVYGGKVGS